jgi:hypothetical protein
LETLFNKNPTSAQFKTFFAIPQTRLEIQAAMNEHKRGSIPRTEKL